MEKGKKFITLFVFILVLIAAFIFYSRSQPAEKVNEYHQPMPEDAVRFYFTSWNTKNYPDMYSTLSDGFKKMEPTAHYLLYFQKYVESQGVEAVNLLNVKETSNDGITATVDYDVELVLGEGNEGKEKADEKKRLTGTFTLKNRQSDIIRGWKLIHPYGNYTDTS